MSITVDRRTRKRLATRQNISDAATRLFIQRGFDNVTIDDIAEAADVGRKTVFNHFARKEDMFFDLNDLGRHDLEEAINSRNPQQSLIETLRGFARQSVANDRPYVRFLPESKQFVDAVKVSPSLLARARAIRDEIGELLADALSKAAGRPPGDPGANLASSLFVTIWVVAATEAHRIYHLSGDAEEAKKLFLDTIDRGARGLSVTMEGTCYARTP